MPEEHLFTAEVATPGEPKPKSTWKTCLTGCLITAVVLLVVTALLAYWIANNIRPILAGISTWTIRQGIESSELPVEQKREIMAQVERVATAFREEKITEDQFKLLVKRFVESPLIAMIMTSAIEKQYLAKSGLSDQEKVDGAQSLRRFIRGVIDEKIKEPGIDVAMVHVATRNSQDDDWQLKNQLTDEELRAFFAEAKKQADEAGVAEQPEQVDPSEEVRKIVDEALAPPGEPAVEPVAEPAAEPAT